MNLVHASLYDDIEHLVRRWLFLPGEVAACTVRQVRVA